MSTRCRGVLLRLAAVAAIALAVPSAARAERGLELGIADQLFQTGERNAWLDRTMDLGAGYTKLFVSWRGTVSGVPGNPRNPADPAYSFNALDAAVVSARERGLKVLIGFHAAPNWAEGAGRPGSAPVGTWKPNPGAVGDFAAALAKRYSGSFGGLPRVGDIQLWNEENLSTYLTPQWVGDRLFAAEHYRKMLNAAHAGVRSAGAGQRLVAGGTAPYGETKGGTRTRPLEFWREVLCLKKGRKLKPAACPRSNADRAHFDVMAHHPINTSGRPTRSALHPDDVSSPDMGNLRKVLRAAERKNRVFPGGKRPLWVTETWWESNPPDKEQGISLRRHAAYISESLYLFWKAGVSNVIHLRVRDGDHAANPLGRIATGLYFIDGTPKAPSVKAFRFPFHADRTGARGIKYWGKAPRRGKVVIQRGKGKGWKTIARDRARGNRVFSGRLSAGKRVKLRARMAGGRGNRSMALRPR